MRQDPIWQAFARTGDPMYYLLYRAAEEQAASEADRAQTSSQTAGTHA